MSGPFVRKSLLPVFFRFFSSEVYDYWKCVSLILSSFSDSYLFCVTYYPYLCLDRSLIGVDIKQASRLLFYSRMTLADFSLCFFVWIVV